MKIFGKMPFLMEGEGDGKGSTGTPPGDQKPAGEQKPADQKPTGEQKPAGDQKPADQKSTLLSESPKPEDYVVKFPDDVQIDKERVTKFTDLAKKVGLKSGDAQQVADFYVEMQKEGAQKHVEIVTKWAEDSKSDKEFGGEHFQQNLDTAKKALDRLATPALKELLGQTGLGNHPEMIRLLYKVGKSISEDNLPGGDGNPDNSEPSLDQQFREAYPNSPEMFPQKG